jgi:hypothetical protein
MHFAFIQYGLNSEAGERKLYFWGASKVDFNQFLFKPT